MKVLRRCYVNYSTWAFITMSLSATVSAAPTIGVLQWGGKQATALQNAIRRAEPGVQVVLVPVEQFASAHLPQEVSLLVVPEAHRPPAPIAERLQEWVRSRKGVLFVSEEPPLSTWLYRAGERWVERQEALHANGSWRALWRGQPAPGDAWRRATNAPEIESSWSLVDTPHGKGYRLSVPKLTGWCTYDLRLEQPYHPGETLMRFWAKGDQNTRALSVEWRERDGSRWVATVPLSEGWKRYALEPSDFRYWRDNPSQGRGGAGDLLKPENAVEISIGLAHSFASYPADTPLEATIADIQVGRLLQALPSVPSFRLEGIAPWYKFYRDSRGRWCSVMRHRGVGIGGQAPGRRIVLPLGERACLFLSAKGDTEGSVWAWLPTAEANTQNLSALLQPMRRGWYLLRAGTERFGFWREQKVPYGAEVVNWRREPITLRLNAELSAPGKPGVSQQMSVRLQPGERQRVLFPEADLPEGEWHIRITARATDGTHDELEHLFHVISKPAAQPLIRVQGGHFVQGDKPLYAHGINFWPLWIAGQEPDEYWGHWLGPEQYDPHEIERALRIAKRVGFNVLSIQYTNLSHAPQLMDFLERARRHGMFVNLFITAAHPFGFDPPLLRQLIEAARIPQWDNIFAYDIAWEPVWGTHAERKRFDPAWREWIVEQYGSIENAERDWGYSLPREEGEVTNPTDEQILNDGEWRRMVAAYRRFLDDHVNRAYWRVVRFIRTLDNRHLIGVRTGWGGNGNPWADWRMPYDLLAGAPFLDFVSPEGYSLDQNWQNFRAGGFITAYARWAGNGKPVFWAEFGATIYPNTSAERIAYQRNVYEWMYRMIEESRADGSAGWWFPGGYRTTEDSDYGIIHPDGTLRPAAQVAQRWASRLAQLPAKPDEREVHLIPLDRDLHPRGFSQVWARHRDEYLKAVESGKRVELRTEGTGTTSENVPLVAVGNVPCNGNNPPKYLNAQVLQVEAVSADGKASDIQSDQPLPPDTVRLRVTVMNTGETTWVPADKRRVELAASWGERQAVEQSVARYETTVVEIPCVVAHFRSPEQPASIRLQLVEADGRAISFGERRKLHVVTHQ
jgi:hypothetical protein